jgi:hypothetical protein
MDHCAGPALHQRQHPDLPEPGSSGCAEPWVFPILATIGRTPSGQQSSHTLTDFDAEPDETGEPGRGVDRRFQQRRIEPHAVLRSRARGRGLY